MSNEILRNVLQQDWVHSREEDSETEMVFRPSSYGFPPARGRKSFSLKPNGTLIEGGIAPNDAQTEIEGTWSLEGGYLSLYVKSASKPSRVLKIISVDKDRLVVTK
jgi:hypothetical protein